MQKVSANGEQNSILSRFWDVKVWTSVQMRIGNVVSGGMRAVCNTRFIEMMPTLIKKILRKSE